MGEVIKFQKPDLKIKSKAHTFCKSGFHKWRIVTEKKFDTKQGKLVTLYRCQHCQEEKIKTL